MHETYLQLTSSGGRSSDKVPRHVQWRSVDMQYPSSNHPVNASNKQENM